MSRKLFKILAKANDAVMAGNSQLALAKINDFAVALAKVNLDDDSKEALRDKVNELLRLAEASMRGAKSASDKIIEIIEAARTFQAYDEVGKRQETSIVANLPRRF